LPDRRRKGEGDKKAIRKLGLERRNRVSLFHLPGEFPVMDIVVAVIVVGILAAFFLAG